MAAYDPKDCDQWTGQTSVDTCAPDDNYVHERYSLTAQATNPGYELFGKIDTFNYYESDPLPEVKQRLLVKRNKSRVAMQKKSRRLNRQ
jgi:hypothetical protein